jgi:hypothetical protein
MFAPLTSLCRGWRAALLLVAVACATPGRAAAECGDHVIILNAKASASRDGRATPSSTEGAAESPVAPRPPCSGPNCSSAPERHPPPSAPVPSSGPTGKEAAQALVQIEQPDRASARVGDLMSPRPIRRASSVFHPPRVG